MTTKIRTVLFDLDGTLVDTAPDLAGALNKVLMEEGREALPFQTIRPVVSHGGKALIELGFPDIAIDSEEYQRLRQRLLDIYRDNIADASNLFPGMAELLIALEERQMRWGVVTNKPRWLTEPLMIELGLHDWAACVVSGDTTDHAKPHPAPMLHACDLVGNNPEECLYIGDAARDIEAGKNVGMPSLVALFGYIGENDQPDSWGGDGMIQQPKEILDWLDSHG